MIEFINGFVYEIGTTGLLGIIAVCIAISIHYFTIRKRKKQYSFIYSSYGVDQILEDYGRKKVSFPIIGFGGWFIEPVQVHNLKEYQEKYFFQDGFGVKYFIDEQGKKYNLKRAKLQNIKPVEQTIGKLSFEEAILSNEIIPFTQTKEKIITLIKEANRNNNSGSVYGNQLEEFKNANTFQELVEIMDKGIY